MVRAIRGDLPPAAGQRWLLAAERCRAELTTGHPILGVRTHALDMSAGTLTGLPDRQFELALVFGCGPEVGADAAETGVLFRSTSVTRPETFRYIAKGELHVGDVAGIGVVRIRDLSWTAGGDPGDMTRILTISTSVERRFWEHRHSAIPTPWLTRSAAEVFLHTEWHAVQGAPPAA